MSVVTFGETLGMIRSLTPGSIGSSSALQLGSGGAESNVAIGLRRLDVPVRWLGRVGDDSIGSSVLREIRGEGVDVIGIVDATAPTALMVKETRIPGSSRVAFYRDGSAGSRLAMADLDLLDIPSARLLHVSGISSGISEQSAVTAARAVQLAHSTGVAVSFDVNHRPSLWGGKDAGHTYRRIAAGSRIVFAGVDEAAILFPGSSDPERLATAIAELGPTEVIIKLGAEGCLVLADGVAHHHNAIPITALDTVGAGDAFVAGYLAEWIAGRDVDARMRLAVTTGAFACLNGGDWEGYPTRAELPLLTATEPVTR